MASNFGPLTSDPTISRFRDISPWADIGQALGGPGFGNIVSVAVVPRPREVSIFFVAQAGGAYRLWHTVRLHSGSWSIVEDVLAFSGDAPAGTSSSFEVSAGICPKLGAAVWNTASTEILIAIYRAPFPSASGVLVMRRVPTPQYWPAGRFGQYSPLRAIPVGAMSGPLSPFGMRDVVVTARPFRDNLVPAP
jgi:hypothetical protein